MSNDKLAILILVFGIINLTVIIAATLYHLHSALKKKSRQRKVEHYGDSAEKKVVDFLKKCFPKATVLKDVYLKTPQGLTEIDTILISDRGIFIIEVKSHNGYIVTEGKVWTQRWRDKVIRFHNPIHQNNVHVSALENLFRKRQSLASLPVYPVVVFTSNNVSFSKNVKNVIKLSSLSSFIKRKKPDKRMTKDMRGRVEAFITSNMETRRLRQREHKKKIYESNQKKRAYRINYR